MSARTEQTGCPSCRGGQSVRKAKGLELFPGEGQRCKGGRCPRVRGHRQVRTGVYTLLR